MAVLIGITVEPSYYSFMVSTSEDYPVQFVSVLVACLTVLTIRLEYSWDPTNLPEPPSGLERLRTATKKKLVGGTRGTGAGFRT